MANHKSSDILYIVALHPSNLDYPDL